MLRCSLLILLGLAGCASDTLETGYRPRKLGDSASQRRAYYAPAYSPEAAERDADGREAFDARRPGTR